MLLGRLFIAPVITANDFNDADSYKPIEHSYISSIKTIRAQSGSISADSLITYAETFLGTPYRHGSHSRNGFDCSGFTHCVYSKFGVNLPFSSGDQSSIGTAVSTENLKPGDLLFFTGRNRYGRHVGHVAIVHSVVNGIVRFIHASSSKGITIESLSSAYYRDRFLMAKRLVNS